MNEEKRDELLLGISVKVATIDERTANIAKTTESQEKHLIRLNNSVGANVLLISKNTQRLDGLETFGIRFSKKQTAVGGGSIITILGMLVVAIGKLLNWW